MVSVLINVLLPINISFVFTIGIMDVASVVNFCVVDLIVVVTVMCRSLCRSLDFTLIGHHK